MVSPGELPEVRWRELCAQIRSTDDVSFKLLGFVPLLSLASISATLLTAQAQFSPLLVLAIQAAAEANPETHFALIDSAFSDAEFNPVELDNAKPILFNTAEAAFLAGYLAAGMSETGTVATFGGIQIPSVAIFMDGFADGVAKYNEDEGTDVKLLGWDKAAQTGSFTGDFENQANGQNLAQGFIDQGADIIMPVAGPVGLGAGFVHLRAHLLEPAFEEKHAMRV